MKHVKTIVIAGGAGFLGSHLCDKYMDYDYRVICVDNLSSGRLQNIYHLTKKPNFMFLEHDVCQSLIPKLKDYKIDLVANFASPASPPHYQRLALETLQVGSVGTLCLLDLARVNKARFFQASTSEVYGDPEVHPQSENYKGSVNCYGPRSMYDESKRYAEALIYSYRRKFGLSTVIARFFNTYGARMDPKDGRVVSNFIVQALTNIPMTIYGDGTQTRSFCYVDDLIHAICLLIESEEEGPMNLGNPTEFTMLELAERVKRLTSSKSKIVHKPLPEDDPLQRKPDIRLAREKLGWQPKISLEQGLKQTITYFQKSLKELP